MKNKTSINSVYSKSNFQENISKILYNFFVNANYEMDFAQGGIFLSIEGKENRYSREEIILGLINNQFSTNDILICLNLGISFDNKIQEIEFFHLLLYSILEKYLEVEGFNEIFSKELIKQKNIIKGFIILLGNSDNDKVNSMKEIIGEIDSEKNFGIEEVNKSVEGVLKDKKN